MQREAERVNAYSRSVKRKQLVDIPTVDLIKEIICRGGSALYAADPTQEVWIRISGEELKTRKRPIVRAPKPERWDKNIGIAHSEEASSDNEKH